MPRAARWESLGVALVLGGALGNAIDRLIYGYVIDFIEVYLPFLPWRMFNPWPAFNIADSAISVGVAVLIVDSLLRTRPAKG
jgi:signal peptidase II